jgi:GntP family gluconate:H+ symporter
VTGLPLIFAFVIAIIVMIAAIAKFKIHPFLAILGISVIFGLVGGIPLVKTGKVLGIADVVSAGFAGTFTSIGIVIIMGALVGSLLEKTGAALKMADCVVKLVGKNNTSLAVLIMGWIVSIPVFCDSGFVILNPIRRALVRRTHASGVGTAVAMSMGLYISHCFIPPTPGPIAAANTIYDGMNMEPNLMLIIIMGVCASILPMIAAYCYSNYIGKRVKTKEEREMTEEGGADAEQSYEELIKSYGQLPSAFMSFAPIVVPILLMGISSAMAMAGSKPAIVTFLGTPIIAISVGVILGIILLFQSTVENKKQAFYDITNETLQVVGPILFITAAGGVLGKVIASTDMVNFIKQNSTTLASLGIFFPFILSAILKTAQGSSTVALTTTAGIMAPLMGTLGLATPTLAAITVIAIGAGAMTVSHANDSYFWVVTNFGDMEVEDGYRAQTMGTLVTGIAAMINVYIIYLIMR